MGTSHKDGGFRLVRRCGNPCGIQGQLTWGREDEFLSASRLKAEAVLGMLVVCFLHVQFIGPSILHIFISFLSFVHPQPFSRSESQAARPVQS